MNRLNPSGLAFSSSQDINYYTEEEDPVISLRRAWLQEKFAPEILFYKSEILLSLSSRIQTVQEILSNPVTDATEAFKNNLYQLEMDRVQYLIASYLRIRLQKVSQERRGEKKATTNGRRNRIALMMMPLIQIEAFSKHISQSSNIRERLSPQERQVLEKYLSIEDNLIRSSVLDKIKDTTFTPNLPAIAPKLDAFVYCRVRRRLGDYAIDE